MTLSSEMSLFCNIYFFCPKAIPLCLIWLYFLLFSPLVCLLQTAVRKDKQVCTSNEYNSVIYVHSEGKR